MLAVALTFLSVALVAGILGFGGLSIGSAGFAQAVFFVSVAGFTCAILANTTRV